jgi:signal recognition particle subunit SRP9
VEDWDTFYSEAEKLYVEHPAHVRRPAARPRGGHLSLTASHLPPQTRYVTKYRHCDGKLVLKVTNDRVVRLAPPHSAPARLAPSGQLGVGPGVPVSRGRLARPVPARAQCLKFETDQAQDVKRLEKLNTLFFSYMCGKDPHADTELDGALSPTQRAVRILTRRTVLALACRALAGGKGRLQPAA